MMGLNQGSHKKDRKQLQPLRLMALTAVQFFQMFLSQIAGNSQTHFELQEYYMSATTA